MAGSLLAACSSSVRFSSARSAKIETERHFSKSNEVTGDVSPEDTFIGLASYYDDKFDGKMTADGEIFDQSQLTAAHLSLPFGTTVEVKNLKNNKTVVVRINDRGPYAEGRIIDLSKAAAEQIGMLADGVAKVRLRILSLP